MLTKEEIRRRLLREVQSYFETEQDAETTSMLKAVEKVINGHKPPLACEKCGEVHEENNRPMVGVFTHVNPTNVIQSFQPRGCIAAKSCHKCKVTFYSSLCVCAIHSCYLCESSLQESGSADFTRVSVGDIETVVCRIDQPCERCNEGTYIRDMSLDWLYNRIRCDKCCDLKPTREYRIKSEMEH